MKILAIGAHFDDIEMGCAGTLLKHIKNGDEVIFAITHSDEFRTGPVHTRMKEQDKALDIMDLEKPLYLFAETDPDAYMIGELDKLNADVIFAHFESDTHQHHRRSSIIAQAVGRKRSTTMLFYDSGSTYDFHPNVFSMIDMTEKGRVLDCYKSQIKHGAISLDILENKNAYWATLISDKPDSFAEGFVVRKMKWSV